MVQNIKGNPNWRGNVAKDVRAYVSTATSGQHETNINISQQRKNYKCRFWCLGELFQIKSTYFSFCFYLKSFIYCGDNSSTWWRLVIEHVIYWHRRNIFALIFEIFSEHLSVLCSSTMYGTWISCDIILFWSPLFLEKTLLNWLT